MNIAGLLQGKKGIVMGLANDHSIAWGCAKSLSEAGAELLLSYGHPKAESYVKPLADQLNATVLFCDVTDDVALQHLFDQAKSQFGSIDFVIHSLAFCPLDDLHGRTVDCSRDGFNQAMQISCYSFLQMARLAEPLMTDGGALLAMSYYGADKVIPHYNIMGPVKAALEACVRYSAVELGEKAIRCHAISPGPIQTRAASGVDHFNDLLSQASQRSPLHHTLSIDDVGYLACFLASDAAKAMTGQLIYVDCGYSILG